MADDTGGWEDGVAAWQRSTVCLFTFARADTSCGARAVPQRVQHSVTPTGSEHTAWLVCSVRSPHRHECGYFSRPTPERSPPDVTSTLLEDALAGERPTRCRSMRRAFRRRFLHEKLRFHVAHLSAKSPVLETQKTRIADQKLTALSTQKRSRLLYEKLFSHCFGRLINRLLRRTRPAFKTTPCFLDAKG